MRHNEEPRPATADPAKLPLMAPTIGVSAKLAARVSTVTCTKPASACASAATCSTSGALPNATGIVVVPLTGFQCAHHGFRATLLESDPEKWRWILQTLRTKIDEYVASGA